MRTKAILIGLAMGLTVAMGGSRTRTVKITSMEDMIAFSEAVNSGESYLGTTVELETDIDFNGARIEPIGSGTPDEDGVMSWAPFEGTFDGKEHLIKNVSIASGSMNYVGLFGYTRGATIRNIAVSTNLQARANKETTGAIIPKYAGTIVGLCDATSDRKCVIENCFTWGTVLVENENSEISVGGIIGACEQGVCEIRNVVQSASSTVGGIMEGGVLHLGGIVGKCGKGCHITNAIVYGITINGCSKPRASYIGGSVGYAGPHTAADNCVLYSFVLSFFDKASAGTIAGVSEGRSNADPNTFTHCYWDETHNDFYTIVSSISVSNNTNTAELVPYSRSQANVDLLDKLIAYTASKEDEDSTLFKWSCLLFNTRRESAGPISPIVIPVGFWINFFQLERPLCKECPPFEEWYLDDNFERKYSPEYIGEGTITLYGKWADDHIAYFYGFDNVLMSQMSIRKGKTFTIPEEIPEPKEFERWIANVKMEEKEGDSYVAPDRDVTFTLTMVNEVPIVFYSNNVKFKTMSQEIGGKITFPETSPTLKGHTFGGWKIRGDTELTNVPNHKVVYDAIWTVNTYKVTFMVGSDNIFAGHMQEYGTRISVPRAKPTRSGLKFKGWVGNIEKGARTVPDHDLVFYATWTITKDTLVAIAMVVGGIGVVWFIVRSITKSDEPEKRKVVAKEVEKVDKED